MKYSILLLVILCGCRQWILEHVGAGAHYHDSTNFNFLAGMLDNYKDVYGKMPSNLTDKEGKDLLSWRVVLLKHGTSEELELYKQFKLDEPWNSPHNMKVACFVSTDMAQNSVKVKQQFPRWLMAA